MTKMTRQTWLQTPYARSDAQKPDQQIERLLEKYKVSEYQSTRCRGPNGRPATMVRFNLAGKTYRVAVETLDAQAEERELLLQSKRAVYWMLKSALEAAAVFFKPEEALFAFLELPDQSTAFEAMAPHMDRLTSENFGRLMLPAAKALPDAHHAGR